MVLSRKEKDFSFLGSLATCIFEKKSKCAYLMEATYEKFQIGGAKNRKIHCQVKCTHLVPEPGNR
jgi:hypothetical protein